MDAITRRLWDVSEHRGNAFLMLQLIAHAIAAGNFRPKIADLGARLKLSARQAERLESILIESQELQVIKRGGRGTGNLYDVPSVRDVLPADVRAQFEALDAERLGAALAGFSADNPARQLVEVASAAGVAHLLDTERTTELADYCEQSATDFPTDSTGNFESPTQTTGKESPTDSTGQQESPPDVSPFETESPTDAAGNGFKPTDLAGNSARARDPLPPGTDQIVDQGEGIRGDARGDASARRASRRAQSPSLGATPIPNEFAPSPADVAWAAVNCPGLLIYQETEAWKDKARSRKSDPKWQFSDWNAAWRGAMRQAYKWRVQDGTIKPLHGLPSAIPRTDESDEELMTPDTIRAMWLEFPHLRASLRVAYPDIVAPLEAELKGTDYERN